MDCCVTRDRLHIRKLLYQSLQLVAGATIITSTLSACVIFWPVGLWLSDVTHPVEQLVTQPSELSIGIRGVPYHEFVRVGSPQLGPSPWIKVVREELPPGIEISVTEIGNNAAARGVGLEPYDSYLLEIRGTPTQAGEFIFTLRLECCMSMAGAGVRAAKRVELKIRE